MQLNDLFDEAVSEVNRPNENLVLETPPTSEAFYSIKNQDSILPSSCEKNN
jgi:hypothetical protein